MDTSAAKPGGSLARDLGRPPRILIAEDDDDVRTGLAHLFTADGYDVRILSRGDDLLERLAGSLLLEDAGDRPDVIVTDVRLPRFNGLAIIEGLRRAGWSAPVFVISAFADETTHRRVQRLGAASFFSKPLEIDRLLAAVRHAVLERCGKPPRGKGQEGSGS